MYIKSIGIVNYKSYLTSPELELSPGFNYIVGQNDAGKTALLEAISLNFINKPHRNLQTLPSRSSKFPERSSIDIVYALTRDELLEAIASTRGSGIYVPAGRSDSSDDVSLASAHAFIASIAENNTFRTTFTPEMFIRGDLNNYAPDHEGQYYFRQIRWDGNEFIVKMDAQRILNIHITGSLASTCGLEHTYFGLSDPRLAAQHSDRQLV